MTASLCQELGGGGGGLASPAFSLRDLAMAVDSRETDQPLVQVEQQNTLNIPLMGFKCFFCVRFSHSKAKTKLILVPSYLIQTFIKNGYLYSKI